MDFINTFYAAINILMVSIPEQLFLILMALILLNQVDIFYPFTKYKAFRILIAAFVPALISVYVKSIGLNMNFLPLVGITAILGAIIFLCRITELKQIVKALVFVVLSFLIMSFIQLLLVTFIQNGSCMTAASPNHPGMLIFLQTLPERVIEIIIIAAIMLHLNNYNKIALIETICKNRILTSIFLVISILNLFLIYNFTMNASLNKVLMTYPPLTRVSIIISVIIFPIVNMAIFLLMVYLSAERNKDEQVFIKNEFKALKALIYLKLREGNYMEINNILADFDSLLDNKNDYIRRKRFK